MKKRIVALLLAVTVLFTGVMLTACGDNEENPAVATPKSTAEVINAALKKTSDLDSMSATMKMEMDMSMQGMTMSVPITAKIKVKDAKSDNAVVSVAMSMSMLGQELEIEMYQEGQWAYVVMGDMKYKCSAEDMKGELDYADSANDMLKEIPEELLKDVQLVQTEDGSQTATIPFPAEKFAELYEDLIESMNSETGTNIGEMKISDAVVTITMAGDYATGCDIAFTMDMTVEGISTTTKAKAMVTYENPGQQVTITPPAGYQDFEEMDLEAGL